MVSMDVEAKLRMSLHELIALDARGGPGLTLMQELRSVDAQLSPEDKLCMSLDDILGHSKAHTQSACDGNPPGTVQRPKRRRQLTHLRRIYFPP